MDSLNYKPKEKKSFKYLIFFIIFLGLGVALGVYGTKRYLMDRTEDTPEDVKTTSLSEPDDITNDSDYKTTIEELYSYVSGNAFFYNSKAFVSSKVANQYKLSATYSYLTKKNNFTTETLPVLYDGLCANNFKVDAKKNDEESNECTLNKYSVQEFKDKYKKIFNDITINTDSEFYVTNDKKCILSGDNYLCGNTKNENTGEVITKFSIVKVLLDSAKNIYIYDKGYLIDTRSNLINSSLGYAKYYLYSFDSKDYHDELKNDDYLTFKHIFKRGEDNNYYYYGSEVEK